MLGPQHSSNGSMILLGQINQAIGELKAGLAHLRMAAIRDLELVRREMLGRIVPLERSRQGRGWMRYVPWERVAFAAISLLGALGWIKPQWLAPLPHNLYPKGLNSAPPNDSKKVQRGTRSLIIPPS